ncbi:hypothetical protein AB0H42_02970 [Nocardia sp. NPDC050799]|uniref:DUF6973 domain-containing protein n=1 Tax=Nocardia sp. NPDC050799 TaxID=3154842 RepID=UPI0033E75DAC
MAIKEATAFNLASSIKGALSAIREADSEGAESFARLLEDLSETVKTQLVATPDDPYLAWILSEYQTDSSEGEPRLWPEGWMLTAMRAYDSKFEPNMMTAEEIEALEDLFTEQGPLAAYRQANMVDEARAAATESFPESLDDGHGDAFRHIYWNARMTQEFGEDWTQTYATAHEKSGGNPPNREAWTCSTIRSAASSAPNIRTRHPKSCRRSSRAGSRPEAYWSWHRTVRVVR